MFWLSEQGLYAPIAFITLAVLLFTMFMELWVSEEMNGDGTMISKNYMINCLEILFTMSTNLAEGALLAKAFQ